ERDQDSGQEPYPEIRQERRRTCYGSTNSTRKREHEERNAEGAQQKKPRLSGASDRPGRRPEDTSPRSEKNRRSRGRRDRRERRRDRSRRC
ncbi:unnamed protein product, partial [Amoebophrya sp. A25]